MVVTFICTFCNESFHKPRMFHMLQDCLWYRGWSGPPVVNVMDMSDSPMIPNNLSRLTPQTSNKANSSVKQNHTSVAENSNVATAVPWNAPIFTVSEDCSVDAHVSDDTSSVVNVQCSTPVRSITTDNVESESSSHPSQKETLNIQVVYTLSAVSPPKCNHQVNESSEKTEDKNHVSSHINKLVELARQISPIVQKKHKGSEDCSSVAETSKTEPCTAPVSNPSSKDFWIRMERQIRNNLKSGDVRTELSLISVSEPDHSDVSVGSTSSESVGSSRANSDGITKHLPTQDAVDVLQLLNQEKTSILNQTATRTRRISQPSKYSAYQLDTITPGPGEQKRPREKAPKEVSRFVLFQS